MAASSQGASLWASGVELSVSGLPKEQRAALQQLLQTAGGRYSPTLSRRCTHLAVPAGAAAAATGSDKLQVAFHNQRWHGWALHIVDLRWVLDSAAAGRRLDETAFLLPPPPLADSARARSDGSSMAADSCQAGVSAAAHPRPREPLRQSVNSLPLASFAQPAPSLRTQAPSGKHSVQWAPSLSEGVTSSATVGAGGAATAATMAAAVLPAGLERQRREQLAMDAAEEEQEEGGMPDYSKLPMTQAGFIPGAELLQQLMASTAGVLPPAAQACVQQQQSPQQQQPASAMLWSPVLPRQQQREEAPQQQQQQPQQRQPFQPHQQEQLPPQAQQTRQQPACNADADVQRPPPGLANAELLEQLRASKDAQPSPAQPLHMQQQHEPQSQLQPQRQATLSTAELLEQLRASAAADAAAVQQPASTPAAAAAPAAVDNPGEVRPALASLLQQLQQLPSAPPSASGQQQAPAQIAAVPLQAAAPAAAPVASPAAAALPHVQAEAAAAAASALAAQLRGLLSEAQLQPQAGAPALRTSVAEQSGGSGRSTDDLLAALRQQQRQPQPTTPAAAPAPAPVASDLLASLRSLPQQSSFTPLRQERQPDAQPDSVSEGEELPPGKVARQLPPSPDTRLPPTAAPSPAGSGCEPRGSQVADSSGGRVFSGILALVDPALPSEEQLRVRAALEQGGGRLADGGGLGRGVTHVVCDPSSALRWLSMGVGIVSPAWVAQSLKAGRQQRCLAVSADASRHLPAAASGTGGGQQQSQAGSGGSGGSVAGGGGAEQMSSELLQSREARQAMLSQLAAAGGGGGAPAGCVPGAGPAAAHQKTATPAELLTGVHWSVLDAPAAAARTHAAPAAAAASESDEVLIIPDSEDEEEAAAGIRCLTDSQAVVGDLLMQAAPNSGIGGCGGPPAQAGWGPADAWRDAPLLRGVASLTLLLPRDARGELGLDSRSFPLPRQEATAAHLLGFVHSYYQEQMPPHELLQLLQSFPAAEGVAAVLRPAFLELSAVPRGALLGARASFEGLRKATREPGGAVYELLLLQ